MTIAALGRLALVAAMLTSDCEPAATPACRGREPHSSLLRRRRPGGISE